MDEDPMIQLEIKVIDLLFSLDHEAPDKVFKELITVLDLNDIWNIWMFGRNIYHVCYSRPRLVLPLCQLAKRVYDVVPNKEECSSAISISLISESDGFLSCAPQESVFLYGFLVHFKIADPISRLQKVFQQYTEKTSQCARELIIQTLLPMLLNSLDIFILKFPEFLNIILKYLETKDPSLKEELDFCINCEKNKKGNQNKNENNNNSNENKENYEDFEITEITPFKLLKKEIHSNYDYQNSKNQTNISLNNNNNENNNNFNPTAKNNNIINSYFSISESHYLHQVISADDVDTLQRISADLKFSFDRRVGVSLVAMSSDLLSFQPTLVCLSAFYGSLRCFKFLVVNGASVFLNDLFSEAPNSVALYAVVGGDIEIIRILISEKVDFGEAIFPSVSFHRDDLFFWFLEQKIAALNQTSKDDLELIHYAAESNNLNIAIYLIEKSILYEKKRKINNATTNNNNNSNNNNNNNNNNSNNNNSSDNNNQNCDCNNNKDVNCNCNKCTECNMKNNCQNENNRNENENDCNEKNENDCKDLYNARRRFIDDNENNVPVEIKIDNFDDDDDIETPLDLACAYDCVGVARLILLKAYRDKEVPKRVLIKSLSKCISSNSADAFCFLLNYSAAQLTVSDLELMKENHQNGFGELENENEISNLLENFEKELQKKNH